MNSAHIVIRKLLLFGNLSEEEQKAFLSIITKQQNVEAGVDIVKEGSRPKFSTLMLNGFACRHKSLSGDRRQILSFQVPGDISDIHSYILKVMDHSVATLTKSVIACIPHEKVEEVTNKYPNLTRVIWRDTLVESAIYRERMAASNLSALARVAHLLCEQYARLKAVGLASGNSVSLPLTQNDIAEATTMSVVHANRTLQELRRMKLIEFKSRTLTILNWEQLTKVGVFNQRYLHYRDTQNYA